MPLTFNGANSQRLTLFSNLGLTAYPVTMSCWFNTSGAASGILMALSDNANHLLRMGVGSSPSNNVFVQATDPSTSSTVNTTANFTTGAWNHACGVFPSAASRSVYLNAANVGSAATSILFPLQDTPFATRIGASNSSPTDFLTGSVAHAAIWNVELTLAEIQQLNGGLNPKFVRPLNLIAYWPCGRGHISGTLHADRWRNNFFLTEGGTGSPTPGDGIRLFTPTGLI